MSSFQNGAPPSSGGGSALIGLLMMALIIGVIIAVRMANTKVKEGKSLSDAKAEGAAAGTAEAGEEGTTEGITESTTEGTTAGTTAGTTPSTSKPASTPSTGSTSKPASGSGNLLKGILTDRSLYETMAVALLFDTIIKNPRMIQKVAKGTARAVTKTASKVIAKVALKSAARITQGALMKAIPNLAEKAAVKVAARVGTQLGTKAATAAATGPAAPFVLAAEMAFSMFTGYMDSLNLGGFANQTNMGLLNGFRDEVNSAVKEEYINNGAEWPVIYGPFDTSDDFTAIQTKITNKQKDIYTAKLTAIQDGWKNGSRAKLPDTATEDDYVTYFDTNINLDDTFTEAERQTCVAEGGVYKKHPNSSNMYCTWDTAAKCQAPWPIDGGSGKTYYEFNKTTSMCEVRPGAMRVKCEGLGLGVTYNFDTGTCNLSDTYCRRYGADDGVRNGDCAFSKGMVMAEMIFGKTFIRSLVNIFDEDNYEPCPKPNVPNPLTILDPLSQIPGKPSVANYLCASDKCPDDKDKVNGICYAKCPAGFSRKSDSFGNQVNGMCYKCPEGYNPSTAGMCHREGCPPGKEVGKGIGIGFCYDPCAAGKSDNGLAMCADNCPAGYDTLIATCQRNPKTVTDGGTVAKCPDGQKVLGADGPGDLCQPPCPSGQKQMGALCYDNVVDSLSYVPSYSCSSGTNTGLLCTVPLNCTTNWCPSKKKQGCCLGPFWHICNPAVTTCTGGGTTPAKKADCRTGYNDVAGVCWAVSRGGPPTAKSKLEVGVCPSERERVGGMCYKLCSDASWGAGPGFTRSAAGSCLLPAETKGRNAVPRPNPTPVVSDKRAETVGPQKPEGISYRVVPRKRKVPFPSTSESDFKNSTLGKHIQAGINAARNGDVAGLGKAMAATAMVGNPAVVSLGAQDLVDMGVSRIL